MTPIHSTLNRDPLSDRTAGRTRPTTTGRALAKWRCSSYRPRLLEVSL